VLEAVFEQLELKQTVFAELEAVVGPSCVLATNTSALSITAMAAGLEHPERLVGMHFFNPVGLLPLVENRPRPKRTDDATVATAADLTAKLHKRPLLVQDAPAFVVNRILTRLLSVVLAALDAVIRSKRPTRRSSGSACRWRRPCCCSCRPARRAPRARDADDVYPDASRWSPNPGELRRGPEEISRGRSTSSARVWHNGKRSGYHIVQRLEHVERDARADQLQQHGRRHRQAEPEDRLVGLFDRITALERREDDREEPASGCG